MKTPREILFERHRQSEPRLDAIRHTALAAVQARERAHHAPLDSALAVLRKAWMELIWPCRRVWVGMAALWLAVLAVNLEMKHTHTLMSAARSAPDHELVRAFEEQRRLLAELLPPTGPSIATPTRPNAGRRSEGPATFRAC